MISQQLHQSLIVITGAKGVGKTNAAYSIVPPSQVATAFIHDAENSGNRFVQQVRSKGKDFGHYLNLDDRWTHSLPTDDDLLNRIYKDDLPWANSRERDSMIDYYRFVLSDIRDNLTPGKYKVYIHDTIERFEAGMAAFVEANPNKTGWKRKAYGEVWTKGVYPLYRAFLNALYQRGINIVVLTSHLRTPWVDGKPVLGAVEPRGKSILFQLSQLHLWLVNDARNPTGAPAALVFKERLGTIDVDEENDEWNLARKIPPRIPEFSWKNVESYIANGVDMSNLSERERLSSAEQGMLSTTLTDMQMQLMILQTQESLLQKQQELGSVQLAVKDTGEGVSGVSLQKMAQSLYDDGNGLSVAEIAKQIGKPVILVQQWLNS